MAPTTTLIILFNINCFFFIFPFSCETISIVFEHFHMQLVMDLDIVYSTRYICEYSAEYFLFHCMQFQGANTSLVTETS